MVKLYTGQSSHSLEYPCQFFVMYPNRILKKKSVFLVVLEKIKDTCIANIFKGFAYT